MRQLVTTLAFLLTAATAYADDAGALYSSKCAVCHGKDGKGTAAGQKLGAKDLTASKLSEAEMTAVIGAGKNKMPAFKGKLTDAQIQDVAKFVKGLK